MKMQWAGHSMSVQNSLMMNRWTGFIMNVDIRSTFKNVWRERSMTYQRINTMTRLNSGNFRIFQPCEWNLNLNSSDCRASKIIYNDIKLEPISWELNLKNPVLNTCVGVSVGGHPRANFSHTAKDAQNNSTSVDPNLMTVGYIGLKITGVKIAWVDVKSNKYP